MSARLCKTGAEPPNNALQWLAFLIHIREVWGSNLRDQLSALMFSAYFPYFEKITRSSGKN
jgi:hypothetical protein